MNKNAGLLAGVAAASFACGGIGGYLYASYRLQRQLDREMELAKEHYRSQAERIAIREANRGADNESSVRISSVRRPAVVRVPKPDGRGAEGGSVGSHRVVPESHLPDSYREDRIGDPYEGLDPDDYEESATRSFGQNGLGDDDGDLEVDDESEAYGSDDDEDDEDGSGGVDRTEPNPRGPGPYIITEAEFAEELLHYHKLTVTYYGGDQVLADDKNVEIRDVAGTVGEGITSQFSLTEEKGPHIIYVRNDNLEVDFEVSINFGDYKEIVLGIGTPYPKPQHILPGGV